MIIKNVNWSKKTGKEKTPCNIAVPSEITRNPELQERWALECYLSKWLTETYKMGHNKFSLSGYGEYHPNKKPDSISIKALVELMEPVTEKGWVKTLDNFTISIDGKKFRIGFCDKNSKVYSNDGKYYAEIRWDDPNTEEYTEEFNALTYEALVNHRIRFDDDIDSVISIVKDIDNEEDDDSNIVKTNVISMVMYSTRTHQYSDDPEFKAINLIGKVDTNKLDYSTIKVGDYAVCVDENSREYELHVVKIVSIEYDMEYSTDTNPLGKICYVDDLGDWGDDYVGLINESTFLNAVSEEFALTYKAWEETGDDSLIYLLDTRCKMTGERYCYIHKLPKGECDFDGQVDQGNSIAWYIHEYHFTLKAAVERALTPFDEIQFDNVPQEEIDALNPNKPKTDEMNKKFILIRTDGYSIEETGRYVRQEDAHKAMETEYNEYNGNVPEEDEQWLNESGIYDSDAILYNRGDNVYVWKIIAA